MFQVNYSGNLIRIYGDYGYRHERSLLRLCRRHPLGSPLARSLPLLSHHSRQRSPRRLLAKLPDLLSSVQIWQVTASLSALVGHWQALVASFTVILS